MEQMPNSTNVEQIDIAKNRLALENLIKGGANWFFWIAGLSVLNSIIFFSGGSITFVVGLGATQFFDSVLSSDIYSGAGSTIRVMGVGLDFLFASIFAYCGVLGKKRYRWAFITGMILYAVDGVISLAFSAWLGALFHVIALVGLWRGLKAINDLELLERKQSSSDNSDQGFLESGNFNLAESSGQGTIGKLSLSILIFIAVIASAILAYQTYFKSILSLTFPPATELNLIPADLGSDFGLISEQGNEMFPDAREGNVRNFANTTKTKFITSSVIVFDKPLADKIADLFSIMETNMRTAQPNLTFTFGEITSQSIGDRAGYREYFVQNRSLHGGILIFVKSNIIVVVDYIASGSGNFPNNDLMVYAQTILGLIDSPRPSQIVPTITPISLPTITPQENSLTKDGITFSEYISLDNSFQVNLPAKGCSDTQNRLIVCSITSGFLNIAWGASNVTFDDINSEAVATDMLEALKPTGMLTSYSNLEHQGKRNGMYTYCFDFFHENQGTGNGCLGFEKTDTQVYVIQFFTFNLSRDQIIWDMAHSTFELIK